MGPCLISVDLQHDFLDDRDLEPAAERILAGAAGWLGEFRARGLPVVHVRTTVLAEGGPALPHWEGGERRRCVRDTPGWGFASEASPREDEPIVDKTHYSGFQSGRLTELLEAAGADEAVVIGVHLHGCVRSTALDASAAGLRVTVGLDATGSNDPSHAAATRRWMSARGFRFAELRAWSSGAAGAAPPGHAIAAVERANGAAAAWAALEPGRRVAALASLAAMLREQSDRLAAVIADEVHKPLGDARAEIAYAADLASQALASAEGTKLRTADGLARRVPHGTVLLVTPWNNPIAIPVGKVVPALALGNAAIWKPSPHAPATSAALHDLLARLDLPAGTLERVEGGPAETAALVRSGGIDAVSASGSLEAGRALHDLCAGGMVPLQAELGGNNAAIVAPSADIGAAADAIVAGAFSFAGQRCTATRRAIAVGDAAPALRAAIAERVEALRAGDPRAADTTFPPVVSAAAAARLEALLERAAAAGAEVWRPGWAAEPAFTALARELPFVAPAVIAGAAPDSEVVREESFGPVLALIEATTVAEAIARLNDVPQGLVASIHTSSPDDVDGFTRGARAGILKVNQSTAGASASLPFGGLGLSGVGPPEHGPGDIEFFTRWQAVYGDSRAGSSGPAGERRLAEVSA